MRLTKEQSRQRFAEIRALWTAYDPAGAMAIDPPPLDEYDGYCGTMLQMLDCNAGMDDLKAWLLSVLDHMGLPLQVRQTADAFIKKVSDWYQQNWAQLND